MIEITGYYWDEAKKDVPRYDAFVCTTNKMVKRNGRLVMGAGIARDFRDRFRDIDLNWGSRLARGIHDNGFMVTQINISLGGARNVALVAFPTKEHWKNDSMIDLIKFSALTLQNIANIMGWSHVLMTRPGCAMGGLDWSWVRTEISFLDNRFKVINK